jgi:hypothetical protein
MIPMKSTRTTQGEHVFFGTDVKGAEKVRLDATVGGLSSIGKPFMVFITHTIAERLRERGGQQPCHRLLALPPWLEL